MKKWRVVVARGKKVRRKFSWLPEQRLSKPQTTSTTRQTKFLIFTETCQGFSFASVQSTGLWCWQQAKHRPEYLPPSPWWAIYRVGPTLPFHPPGLLIQSGEVGGEESPSYSRFLQGCGCEVDKDDNQQLCDSDPVNRAARTWER